MQLADEEGGRRLQTDGGSPAPIDRPILGYIQGHLDSTAQFARTALAAPDGHLELRAHIDDRYYPSSVTDGVLFVRWYTNDDFTVHYRETHSETEHHRENCSETGWECRWDRHPNPHNTRAHFHPPPDAGIPAEDRSFPADFRDVVRLVLDDIETRIQTLWTE